MEMTKSEEDVLIRMLAIMRSSGVSFSEEVAVQVEMQIRQEVGGQRIYIQKSPARVKTQHLATAIRTGAKISEAMAKAGVSRSHGFRLLNRKSIIS
jgi:hypothetical protein